MYPLFITKNCLFVQFVSEDQSVNLKLVTVVKCLSCFLFQMTRYKHADFTDDDSVGSVQLTEGKILIRSVILN